MGHSNGLDLVQAARSGNLDEFQRLLATGSSAYFRDDREKMALFVACEEGWTEVVELLIDRRLEFNDADEHGSRP